MKNLIFIIPLCFQLLFAQVDDNRTLFTIDGKKVEVAEFKRVYTKNNINNQADYSEASLNEYLNLFINFKLKVLEAENLKMDTIKSIQSELNVYQKQLAKSYFNNKESSDELIKEAYERSKIEVDVSHILIKWPKEFPSGLDSINTLKAINAIKKQANPKNFNLLAKQSSQDPSAKENEGRLGYLSVFQTVYPFESAMYNTAVGKVSDAIATQFGYHIILVHDKRPARGKIQTAHILIKSKDTDSDDLQKNAATRINQVYQELSNKLISFDEAVQKYSEDGKTKFQKGLLPELSSAEMITSFADAAFGLENDGDISKPIKTSIGWHIIQRVSKSEILDFELSKNDLTNKVKRDSRSNVAVEKSLEDTKQRYGFSLNNKSANEVIEALTKSYQDNNFKVEDAGLTKEIFKIGDRSLTQKDFIVFTKSSFQAKNNDPNLSQNLKAYLLRFQNLQIQDYREAHLAEINPEYKFLMQEYHDGILLFELTDQQVWSKAVADTSGLKAFYEANKANYMWKERMSFSKYHFANSASADKGIKWLEKGKSPEFVLDKLNKKEQVLERKSFKQEKESLSESDLVWAKDASKRVNQEDGSVDYFKVDQILKPEPKLLQETRGYVISDYQNYLEKQWIESLKKKYSIKLNQDVFESLIK